MKTDLFTSVVAAIAGILIAYFVTGLFLGPIKDVSFPALDSSVNINLSEPSPEIFNYRALNPTVEVYVGECEEKNEFDECIEVEKYTEADYIDQETN